MKPQGKIRVYRMSVLLGCFSLLVAGCDRPPTPEELLADRGIVAGEEALNKAAGSGDLEVIRLLLAADVPVSKMAMENAVLHDHGSAFQELLAARSGGMLALQHWGGLFDSAVRNRAVAVLRILLDARPDPGLRMSDGEPALVFAVKVDSPELAATLLAAEPDLDLRNAEGHSAMTLAVENERHGLASILFQAGASPDETMPDGSPMVTFAVRQNQRRLLQKLLEKDPDLEAVDKAGKTPLQHAVEENMDTAALDLLQAGAVIGSGAGDLLARAIELRNPDLLRDLLRHGAPVDARDSSGMSPLQLAVGAGEEMLAAILIEAGADTETALLQAIEAGHWHLAPLCMEAGSDLQRAGSNGLTLAELAMAGGQNDLVRQLVARGASPGRGLLTAVEQGNAVLAGLFAELSPPQSPAEHANLLVLALSYKNAAVLEGLLSAGVDPNVPISSKIDDATRGRLDPHNFFFYLERDEGLTPLMLAASMSEPSLVRVLLKAGARRGAVTAKWKRYPINFAAAASDLVSMQLLLGRDPEVTPDTRRVVISLSRQDVKVLEDGVTTFRTSISSGRKGKETPPGEFVITDKHVKRVSTIYDVEMPHFMRLNCSEIGLHGGYLPGYPASAGCIRLPRSDARRLFSILKVGDRVSIVD